MTDDTTEQKPKPPTVYVLRFYVADKPDEPGSRLVTHIGTFPSEDAARMRYHELAESEPQITHGEIIPRRVGEPAGDEQPHTV
ncbi:MAG TPA: hypothetical protein VFE65_24055 [Pseudonocardia sp.]|jgi:hypothetical protein|nr:hypothetical protein [Pseudonocardia sp.]